MQIRAADDALRIDQRQAITGNIEFTDHAVPAIRVEHRGPVDLSLLEYLGRFFLIAC